MWIVEINEAWQSISTDQVRELIERGVVGPQTLVRHEKWREPGRLGQVQAFAPLFAKGSAGAGHAPALPGAAESGAMLAGTPEPSWKTTEVRLWRSLESLVRPAALATGGAAGFLSLAAGLYLLSSGLPVDPGQAAALGSATTFLSVLKTGLGLYFCARGLGTWATALGRFDVRRPGR